MGQLVWWRASSNLMGEIVGTWSDDIVDDDGTVVVNEKKRRRSQVTTSLMTMVTKFGSLRLFGPLKLVRMYFPSVKFSGTSHTKLTVFGTWSDRNR